VLHLKRFSFRDQLWREKLSFRINYPIDGLDLRDFVRGPRSATEPPPIYDLWAVSSHHGAIWGGHYTALVRHARDGRWRTYDDDAVTPAPGTNSLTDAYVLFYRRRDAVTPPAPLLPPMPMPPPVPPPATPKVVASKVALLSVSSSDEDEGANVSDPRVNVSAAPRVLPWAADLHALGAESLD
jgi:hypothetical protein